MHAYPPRYSVQSAIKVLDFIRAKELAFGVAAPLASCATQLEEIDKITGELHHEPHGHRSRAIVANSNALVRTVVPQKN